MPNRSSKRQTTDPNVAAFRAVQHVIAMGEGQPVNDIGSKNPAAVALGHLGGMKGGPASAKALSASKRRAIAKRAARARWKKTPR
jgi:hypothetical protein